MTLTKKQREKLHMKFGGRCVFCGCELPEKGWYACHVKASVQCMKAAEKRIFRLKSTGETFRPEDGCPENHVPACATCNFLKTTYLLDMFRTKMFLQVERECRSSMNFRTRLILVENKPFEQYQGESAE